MAKSNLKEQLIKLIDDDKKRSKTARLREVFSEIDAALSAGVSLATIHKTLTDNGLSISLPYMKTLLYRLRKKQKEMPTRATKPTISSVNSDKNELLDCTIQNETTLQVNQAASSNPRDLDQIMNTSPNLEALAKLAKKKETLK